MNACLYRQFARLGDDRRAVVVRWLAAVSCAGLATLAQAAEVQNRETNVLEEIFVTATKRAERLQDVPMSITAIGGEDIDRRGLVSMSDYLASVPSVSYIDLGIGSNQIIVRGIAVEGLGQSTVSSYLGEIPLATSVNSQSSDVKLVDIERVELLRGPQGTLYGSGSMGGTVRNIPVAPNLQQLEGKISVGLAAVDESDDQDSEVTGVVNLPLVDGTLGLRVAAYRFENAGSVDLVGDENLEALALATGSSVAIRDDVGGSTYTGGRAAILWQPTDNWKVTLTHVTQDLEGEHEDMLMASGRYESGALATSNQQQTDDIDATNILIEFDAGAVALLASSAWVDGEQVDHQDLGRLTPFAAEQRNHTGKKGFVQEVRLNSQFQGPFHVTAGLYYEDFDYTFHSDAEWKGDLSLMPEFFGPDPVFFTQHRDQKVEQKAIFGEVDYAITDSWKVLVGGRWFEYDHTDDIDQAFGGFPSSLDVQADESDTTFKAALTFAPSKQASLYAQWAQGFRLGHGVPGAPADICDEDANGLLDFTSAPLNPGQTNSDRTSNYELGGKFGLLENRVSVNAAVFYIDWDDIPITIAATSPSCLSAVEINAGKARSRGVEFETTAYLSDALHISLGGAYVDAELRSNDIGQIGDRLPLSPKVNGNLSIQYDFDLFGNESFMRSDVAYVGSYLNEVGGVSPESGDYTKLNLRAGSSLFGFNFEIYANNVTNEDAATFNSVALSGLRLRPRTIGVSLSKDF